MARRTRSACVAFTSKSTAMRFDERIASNGADGQAPMLSPGGVSRSLSSFPVAVAPAALRHRLLLSPAAEIEGKQVETLVAELVESTEAPR